jgi:hypothetical protein
MKSSGGIGKLLGLMLIFWICVMLFAYAALRGCERSIEKHKKETGKTILESVGEEARKAKDEFNKGFKPDSIKRDFLNDTLKHIK